MPHRHKHHTHTKAQPKALKTFFQSNQKAAATLLPQTQQITKQQNIAPIKITTLQLLEALKQSIQNTQPEQAQLNQSKALELANQLLAADIYQIQYIQQALDKVCATLHESHYTDGLRIQQQYGKTQRNIQLGQNWRQLPVHQQIYTLLEQTIKASQLSPLPNPAVRSYPETPTPEKWTRYMVHLMQLLPQKPLLLTGTPTSWMPLKPKDPSTAEEEETEEENEPINPDDSAEGDNESGGIGRNILNFFRRKNRS